MKPFYIAHLTNQADVWRYLMASVPLFYKGDGNPYGGLAKIE